MLKGGGGRRRLRSSDIPFMKETNYLKRPDSGKRERRSAVGSKEMGMVQLGHSRQDARFGGGGQTKSIARPNITMHGDSDDKGALTIL